MALYRGHRVALLGARSEGPRVVHFVDNPRAFGRYEVEFMCGQRTTPEVAVEFITSAPLTCVWCIAGRRRFSPGEQA